MSGGMCSARLVIVHISVVDHLYPFLCGIVPNLWPDTSYNLTCPLSICGAMICRLHGVSWSTPSHAVGPNVYIVLLLVAVVVFLQ